MTVSAPSLSSAWNRSGRSVPVAVPPVPLVSSGTTGTSPIATDRFCPIVTSVQTNPMAFVSWSVHPLYDEQDKEFFTSEDHAIDVAYSWSAETHGRTMILQRDGIDWLEVVA